MAEGKSIMPKVILIGGFVVFLGLFSFTVYVKSKGGNDSGSALDGIEFTIEGGVSDIIDKDAKELGVLNSFQQEVSGVKEQIGAVTGSLKEVNESTAVSLKGLEDRLNRIEANSTSELKSMKESLNQAIVTLMERTDVTQLQMEAWKTDKDELLNAVRGAVENMKKMKGDMIAEAQLSVNEMVSANKDTDSVVKTPISSGLSREVSEEEALKAKVNYGGSSSTKNDSVLDDLGSGVMSFDQISAKMGGTTNKASKSKGLVKTSLGAPMDKDEVDEGPKLVIPAGSEASARLFYGFAAPIGGTAVPVELVIGDIFMGPQGSKVPLKGVKVIAKAQGRLSDSRAILQIMSISGVTEQGVAFHVKGGDGMGWVVGPDASMGIKGTLKDVPEGWWYKYGALGVLQGAAGSLAEGATTQGVDSNGRVFSNVVSGKQFEHMLGLGAMNTANKAVEIYNDRLESWEKIVVIEPNQVVVVKTMEEIVIDAIDVGQYQVSNKNRHHKGLY